MSKFSKLSIAIFALLCFPFPLQAQEANKDLLGAMRYRYIGPMGNRVTSVASVPGQPNIYYAGAASGGIFKTTDGGTHWEAVFDAQPVSSIGSLAIAPSDPNTVWAGTGEAWIRSHISVGSGIYKSTDGGLTWKKLTGHGLPTRTTGKVAMAIANSNPNRIYALIETGDGVPVNGKETDRGKLWRSDDGGDNWRLVSYDRTLGGRTHYYFRMAVAPDNENETY